MQFLYLEGLKVYYNIESLPTLRNPVVTTGTFDGVHLGHKTIIERLKEIAKQEDGETVLLTFHPHPRMVLFPDDNELRMLNTLEEKIQLLENAGIDHLIIYPFTKEFSRLSSVEFVRNVLVNRIGTKRLVIGYNHHFGRNREGSFEHLKEFGPLYGFEVEEIPAKDIDAVEVSSTKIRAALLAGDLSTAGTYLGHPYTLRGKVVGGKQLGRTIGYPTANIHSEDPYKLIPADGVYAVKVEQNGEIFGGMLNIGNNPTIPGKGRSIEVNIFDFDRDIVDQYATISFLKRLRDEQKFEGLDALKKQLALDKQNALAVIHSLSA